jgi:hypothetical protein
MIREHFWFPFALIGLYLLFIYYGPKYMATRKPYDLKLALQGVCVCVCVGGGGRG